MARTAMRPLALAIAVVAAVVTTAAIAGADAPIEHQAWSASGPLAPVAPADRTIYVAQTAGSEQARAFVEIAGGASASATLELTESSSSSIASDQGAITGCLADDGLDADGKVASGPEVDCSIQAPLTRAADGTWTLPLEVFAGGTGAAGLAVALVPVLDGGAPTFTIAFDTSRTGVRDVEPAAPPAEAPAAPSPPETIAFPPSGSGTIGPLTDPAALVPPSATRPPRPPVAPIPRGTTGAAGHGSGGGPHPILLVPLAVLAAGALLARRRRRPEPLLGPELGIPVTTLWRSVAALAAVGFVASLSEAAAYKLGFVAIVFIGAIGLHLLVNWTGELSLAHASFIGLPAFVVAQLAAHSGWSPILFVPVGVVVGGALGLVVAIAALRTRGLQVALVTLAAGIAITQFLFVRSWVIGPPAGLDIPTPALFGLRFETNRGLIPVLAVLVLVAVATARSLLASKVGRAMSLIRSDPRAAAAVGIPVASYRAATYGLAGAFAGLAGAAYVLWVQRVSPTAFPLNLGFNYLVIATLAGKGGLLGVALSALLLEGGRLFSIIPESISLYLGPIALIYNVTRYQEGINGLLRNTTRQLRAGAIVNRVRDTIDRGRATSSVRIGAVIGFVLVIVGFGAITLAWYHAGNTDLVWIQNQELLSGGLGGGGLIVFGSALLIRDALLHGPAVLRRTGDGETGTTLPVELEGA